MRVTEAFVLAGGLGTRLRSVVHDRPKPMALVAGRPFLEWQFEYWRGQGIQRFVVSTGYLGDVIRSHFGARHEGCDIAYVHEASPRGTGGALLQALPQLRASGHFLMLNGDTWFEVPLAQLQADTQRLQADWCLALRPMPATDRYLGVCVDDSGHIRQWASVPPTAPDAGSPAQVLINGGVYLVNPASLPDTSSGGGPLSLERDLFPQWLDAGVRFAASVCPARFLDIGVPEDYRRAEEVMDHAR